MALVDGASWAGIVTAFGTVGIALGVVVAGVQLRDARKVRSAQIAAELADRWESERFAAARDAVNSVMPPGSANSEEGVEALAAAVIKARDQKSLQYYHFTRYLNFFEQLGASHRRPRYALKTVERLMGGVTVDAWQTWERVIALVWGNPTTVGQNFGSLARALNRRRKRRVAVRRFFRSFY